MHPILAHDLFGASVVVETGIPVVVVVGSVVVGIWVESVETVEASEGGRDVTVLVTDDPLVVPGSVVVMVMIVVEVERPGTCSVATVVGRVVSMITGVVEG